MKKIATASDYHDFPDIVHVLNTYGNYRSRVKYFEVGFSTAGYVAILYTGKKPGEKSVRDTLDKLNIKLL